MVDNRPPPGWYQDPTTLADSRYWDGVLWTDTAARDGTTLRIHIDPELAAVPPLPGTETRPSLPTPHYAAPARRRSSPALVLLVLLVALLIVVVVIIVAAAGDSTDEAPTPTPASDVPAESGP